MVVRMLPTVSIYVNATIKWQLRVHEYINELLKLFLKIRQAKIALKQTLALKLGVTLVLENGQRPSMERSLC